MALPLWGELEKAQDSNQTIEQAIAAAIVAHEEDPTAHLGVGESLQSHKHDPIIDHPAQSVVLDKTPFSYYEEYKTGIGLQNWSAQVGNFIANTDTRISANSFSQSDFEAVGGVTYPYGSNYPDSDLMVQFKLRLTRDSQDIGKVIFGWTNDLITSGSRMVFENDGTVWKWRIYSGSTIKHSFSITSSWKLEKYFRIFFDSVENKIVLYQGSTVLSTYNTVNWKDYIFNYLGAYFKRTTSKQHGITLEDWKSTYSLNIDS